MRKIIVLVLILFSLTACSTSSTSSNPETDMTKNQSQLLFFWLPTGAPCQEQDRILQSFLEEYPNLSLEYVDATNENDREKFYQYGVRSLPTLVLLNKTGEIQKQFSPGIHSKEEIVTELSKI